LSLHPHTAHRAPPSFPTRRSSDLSGNWRAACGRAGRRLLRIVLCDALGYAAARPRQNLRGARRAHFRGPQELSVPEWHDARVRRDADAPGICLSEPQRGAELRLRQLFHGVVAETCLPQAGFCVALRPVLLAWGVREAGLKSGWQPRSPATFFVPDEEFLKRL